MYHYVHNHLSKIHMVFLSAISYGILIYIHLIKIQSYSDLLKMT